MVLSVLFYSCGPSQPQETEEGQSGQTEEVKPADNTLTEQEKLDGWKLLFNGISTKGWRGFNEDSLPAGWVVEKGTLKSLGKGGDIGGDIVYDEVFGEFELSLDWKISKGGNSGILYHIVEGPQYKAPYENAPEYQVLDDLEFPEPIEDWQKVGADYAMYVPDSTKTVKPAGSWNHSRILFTNEHVEYWLNGKQTVEFVPWSDDWNERRMNGKWKDYPDYGKAREGMIGLQDHGSFIWYKNIKIRTI